MVSLCVCLRSYVSLSKYIHLYTCMYTPICLIPIARSGIQLPPKPKPPASDEDDADSEQEDQDDLTSPGEVVNDGDRYFQGKSACKLAKHYTLPAVDKLLQYGLAGVGFKESYETDLDYKDVNIFSDPTPTGIYIYILYIHLCVLILIKCTYIYIYIYVPV